MIKVVAVGEVKHKFLENFVAEYEKRLKRFHKINIIEVKQEQNLEKEMTNIKKHLNPRDYVVILDIEGFPMNSIEFADFISEKFRNSGTITFIIGGPLGIHEQLKNEANSLISLSQLTFTAGLTRGILLEQIYRAFKIINHQSYHK